MGFDLEVGARSGAEDHDDGEDGGGGEGYPEGAWQAVGLDVDCALGLGCLSVHGQWSVWGLNLRMK